MSTISPDNGHRTLNNRAWINEALHLRFDKKVHGKQISKRISIPRTTLQSLFRRFARSGLNWPVPEHISPEQLERLLYPGKSQQYEPIPTREIPEKRRRPNFSIEFKLHLVELSMQPDTNVARLAREHGINDNLLFNWRCKRTRFSSTHFLRFPGFQPSAGILPASGYSGIRGGARRYIQLASAL